MGENRPKRRKDKYNPYILHSENGRYFVAFHDGDGVYHNQELSEQLFEIFNRFELDDLVYLNVWDRHMEHSQLWEAGLNERCIHKSESVEEEVLMHLQNESLYKAIARLPELQQRRVRMRFFEQMSYEKIAEKEKCSKAAVKYSLDVALKNLKKYLES